MADLDLTVTSGVFALSSSEHTALQIKTAANQRAVLKGFIVSGIQAAGGTDAAVEGRFTRSTASFGTGTAATPGKLDPSKTETIQSTCYEGFSAEPTTPTDTGYHFSWNPETGDLTVLWPEPLWMKIPGGQSLQLALTAVSGTPSVIVTFIAQE